MTEASRPNSTSTTNGARPSANATAAAAAAAGLLRLGTLRGFKHFELRARSREEVLLTVTTCDEPRLQVVLSRRKKGDGVGPTADSELAARPLAREQRGTAVFLLAAYTRYRSCPYVWLRACSLGVRTSSEDLPLELQTTQQWREKAHILADVVEDLVQSVCLPVDNAFDVDFAFVERLEGVERACCQAALIDFLHSLLMQETRAVHPAVRSDLCVTHLQYLSIHPLDG